MKEHCETKNRVCTQCKLVKPITDFYLIHQKQYRMAECKVCFRQRAREARLRNIEQYKETNKRYYDADPKKNNRMSRAYQKKFHKKVAKQAIIRYFVKKLKEEFQVDLNIKIRGQTLDELTETHEKLKLRYKYEREKHGKLSR